MTKKPRIKVPKSVKAGEIFQVKSLFPHPMENGLRKDKKTGEIIPRKIIHRVEATFAGEQVFAADLHTAISANPYLAFYCRAESGGELSITWIEDGGKKTTLSKAVEVV
uniref:Sulfur-oxidizing protein SoxZ n=1 Tax=Candidatus Kentrum sp. FM TaxID=2126340 RepID=A0A450T8V8_9GAMM|nr:MAG: sulfur-oxidizing protein SoxZ [Candidatus Kentron sp. FM]VFJ65102.1 MAG: sulfur-oxidizing protein SoxZ [Candidatus Kentron sp. FM]VFK15934.1 MAG: sulfur-oxidizing protein SoxZ [Candidatus Kentron sp. FM]